MDLLPSQKNGSLKTMGPYKNHMVGVGLDKNTLVRFRLSVTVSINVSSACRMLSLGPDTEQMLNKW